MKLSTILLSLFLLISCFGTACAQQKDDKTSETEKKICPPFHKETKETLRYYFSDKLDGEALKKRKEWGLEEISMHEISYLKDKRDEMACRELKKKYPWPVNHRHRGYYKNNEYFFIVDSIKTPPAEKGKVNFNTGYDILTVLDKNYNLVGTILL